MTHVFNANMECNTLNEFRTKAEANATIATSNEQAKTGTYSLKANVTLAGGHGNVDFWSEAKALAELYFRQYVYLPTATYNAIVDNAGDYAVFMHTSDEDVTILARLSFTNVGGTVFLRYDHEDAVSSFTCPSRDAWHCIEIYFKRDAAAGAWQCWVDGASQGSGSGVNTGAKNIRALNWGISESAGMTGAIYIDNIVVATSRIHCLMGNIPQGNALRNRKETPQGWII